LAGPTGGGLPVLGAELETWMAARCYATATVRIRRHATASWCAPPTWLHVPDSAI